MIYYQMNYNEHLQAKLSLLHQYTLCLQRQNQSKTKQIQTLHHHLSLISTENQALRQSLHQLQHRIAQNNQPTVSQCLQTSFSITDLPQFLPKIEVSSQTQDNRQELCSGHQSKIKQLQYAVKISEEKLKNYQVQCQEMYQGIVKLEKELANQQKIAKKYTEKVKSLEDSLQNEQQKRISAEKYLQSVTNSIENTDYQKKQLLEQYYLMKSNLEQLIIQNNMLIQRSRELQREKNDYYHQLKIQTRITNNVNEVLGKSCLKREAKIKDQRWKQIESNLRKLQLQNQAMQSNLMIGR